jgi:hypothetical protein
MAQIKTQSGRTRRVPAHVDIDTIVGLDSDGRIVVHEPWMKDYAFGLTLCCDAWDKGLDEGTACRACYGAKSDDTGNYLFAGPDGTYPGVDPMVQLVVPH